MSQPVKLSDALVLDARVSGLAQQRSIAGQVEFWARLGRRIVELLDGHAQRALMESAGQRPLSELVSTISSAEGKARLKAYLESRPFPHFEPHPTRKGFLVRIEEDGHRSVGRFVNRKFIADTRQPVQTGLERVVPQNARGSHRELFTNPSTRSVHFRTEKLPEPPHMPAQPQTTRRSKKKPA